MSTIAADTGPIVDAAGVTFRLSDAHARLQQVRLYQEVRVPGDQLEFSLRGGVWSLRLEQPAADRMEYLFELGHRNDRRETILDPANALRAPGAFGDKSVIEFAGYRRPTWLGNAGIPADLAPLDLDSRVLGAAVTGELWSPQALPANQPAPLLVAHDGPEYARLGGLIGFISGQLEAGVLPPLRVALLAPGERNSWYAANPAYARALATEVLPALAELAPSTVRIGAGASLGALAMLHAHRLHPACFDGVFLQSGSFFTPATDAQERRFARFDSVSRFVAEVRQAVADPHPVPVRLTCGVLEENLANNEAMADALLRLGYSAQLRRTRDVHNYTAWRDAFDPDLTELLTEVTS